MKKFEIAVILGFSVCVALASFQLPFARACNEVRDDTLRLHIVANSDSFEDQSVKLKVRDAVLTQTSDEFWGAADINQAQNQIERGIQKIERVASNTLVSNGISYDAHAKITRMYFDKRTYGKVTLPAGIYTALRIELGQAAGKNWWCVVYPSLCVPTASDSDPIDEYSDDEKQVVLNSDEYKFKFKLEEVFQKYLTG
ncbi:MAG: stage II sporulation protein R [Oscillospiraceae bacterium]